MQNLKAVNVQGIPGLIQYHVAVPGAFNPSELNSIKVKL